MYKTSAPEANPGLLDKEERNNNRTAVAHPSFRNWPPVFRQTIGIVNSILTGNPAPQQGEGRGVTPKAKRGVGGGREKGQEGPTITDRGPPTT